ncbi:MAG: hypothetical protein M3Z85_06825 [Acidobacteriota bacterium]|nr:hypothetical protein [Acidobacteriota bacterium]
MSDYMFMLESHLNAEQNRVVAEVQAAASAANVNLFLAGGAMRDMLGGFPIRDLDFTVEGNPIKLAKALLDRLGDGAGGKLGAKSEEDEHRRFVDLALPGGITTQIAMSRQERYARPGGKPHITPATVYDDLRRRDFTIDAIALSLNRGSRGLLIDPVNGLADLANRELRTAYAQAFSDDPCRLLRLVRLRHRLQFAIEERTARQFENALESGVQKSIPKRALFAELRHIAEEPSPLEVLRDLEKLHLLPLFSPSLTAANLNAAALTKLEKLRKTLPPGGTAGFGSWRMFLLVLTEKLSTREKADLYRTMAMTKEEIETGKKLAAHAQKLEQILKSARLQKPSHVYRALAGVPADEILYLLYYSQQRLVHDRIRHYLQKYLPAAKEITVGEVEAAGAKAGSAAFQKLREQMVTARLDGRPKRPGAVAAEAVQMNGAPGGASRQ